jgi:RNA polymerase sigma-70 factor (ECF subfamily)
MDRMFWRREDISEEDLQLCVAGDEQAWETLVRLYQSRIYSLCLHFTGSPAEAEDLTQDVFVKLLASLGSYDGGRGGFYPWLKNLTRNHMVDRFRRTKVVRASNSLDTPLDGEDGRVTMADRLVDSQPSQEEHFAKLEIETWVRGAVSKLSDTARDAMVLCALEERDHKEAARVLGVPEGTVKSRLSRGRAELARLLSPIAVGV